MKRNHESNLTSSREVSGERDCGSQRVGRPVDVAPEGVEKPLQRPVSRFKVFGCGLEMSSERRKQ